MVIYRLLCEISLQRSLARTISRRDIAKIVPISPWFIVLTFSNPCDVSLIYRENKARYSSIIVCITFAQYCKKISKLTGILMRLNKLIHTEAKPQIYKTAILWHLTYCNLVWHFSKATEKKKQEQVNERGLRLVFSYWNLAYEDLLKCANLFSLFHGRLQDIVIFMYKFKHRLLTAFEQIRFIQWHSIWEQPQELRFPYLHILFCPLRPTFPMISRATFEVKTWT